jgi:hypothetical protein
MPIVYRVDQARNLVRSVATGVVTDEDFRTWTEELASDPEVLSGMSQLADFRDVDRFDVTPACIRHVVGMEAEHEKFTHAWRAFVVTQDVAYGMVRMYQTLSEDEEQRIRVFRDLCSAQSWLGLTDIKAGESAE